MTIQLWYIIVDDLETGHSYLSAWLQHHVNRRVIYIHRNAFLLNVSIPEAQELKEYPWVMNVVPELEFYMEQ